jgi:hypothetical protein
MSEERIYPTIANLESYLDGSPEHKLRYELAASMISDLHIADIACGVGYGSYLLGKKAKSVKGFDVSESALSHAKSNFLSDNVFFDHAKNFQKDNYEAVISLETIEHMEEAEGDVFLQNIHTNMNDSAFFLISTDLNHTDIRHNVTPYHPREYNFKEFHNKLVSAGFKIDKWYGLSNTVSEKLVKKTFGFSIVNILNLKIHKLLPPFIRKLLSKIILGKNTEAAISSIRLVENNLDGCFCQIALCSKA